MTFMIICNCTTDSKMVFVLGQEFDLTSFTAEAIEASEYLVL